MVTLVDAAIAPIMRAWHGDLAITSLVETLVFLGPERRVCEHVSIKRAHPEPVLTAKIAAILAPLDSRSLLFGFYAGACQASPVPRHL